LQLLFAKDFCKVLNGGRVKDFAISAVTAVALLITVIAM
jgi:hypothetical protein